MLAVNTRADFDEAITDFDYRTYSPFTATTFKGNDEVRISIQNQDGLTLPCESYLHVTGTLTKADGTTEDADLKLVNNAVAFLFEEIRYELGGVVVDRSKNVGITSTLKYLASLTPGEEPGLQNACWLGMGTVVKTKAFSFCLPLHKVMGFFEDYKRIIVNQKQELIMLLSSNFKNAIFKESSNKNFSDAKLTITNIVWRMPHLKVSDTVKLPLLKMIEDDTVLEIPYRSWELHEYPTLPETKRQSWTIKTSSQLEKPRYVILAFQTDRHDHIGKDSSKFDLCSLNDLKLFLNSQYYPYDNLRGDLSLMYDMYARFQSSYYGRAPLPLLDRTKFESSPIFVIDCSKQNESLKNSPVDVRLEFESSANFAASTSAFCLIINDSLVEYRPLTGTVIRVR